ncbi:MAG: DUF4868 domain-containing protein [Bacillota bacterium]
MEDNNKDVKSVITQILGDESGFAIGIFACVKSQDGVINVSKFKTEDSLKGRLKGLIADVAKKQILCDEVLLKSIDGADNFKNVLYTLNNSTDYTKLKFFDEIDKSYSEMNVYQNSEIDNLMGFLFVIKNSDLQVVFYQHIYPMALSKKAKGLRASFAGNMFGEFNEDIIKFDERIDFIKCNDMFYIKNYALLERSFGYDVIIKSKANKTCEKIKQANIVSDSNKLITYSDKSLSNARKLMRLADSPVLIMDKEKLFKKIARHKQYKGIIKFQGESGNRQIILNDAESVKNFILMLNDTFLISELTGTEYNSEFKEKV